MQITKEFLESEIALLAREIDKANAFLIRADGAMTAHKMLLSKLAEPEPQPEKESQS
jgi:hypothetical protein